jgi:hypothetical protein
MNMGFSLSLWSARFRCSILITLGPSFQARLQVVQPIHERIDDGLHPSLFDQCGIDFGSLLRRGILSLSMVGPIEATSDSSASIVCHRLETQRPPFDV